MYRQKQSVKTEHRSIPTLGAPAVPLTAREDSRLATGAPKNPNDALPVLSSAVAFSEADEKPATAANMQQAKRKLGPFASRAAQLEEKRVRQKEADAAKAKETNEQPQQQVKRRRRRSPVPPRVDPNPIPVVAARNFSNARSTRSGSSLWIYFLVLAVIGVFFLGIFNAIQKSREGVEVAAPSAEQQAQIIEVERALASLSFNPGLVDGQFDDQLSAAIAEFEGMADLPVTGQINPALMRELDEMATLVTN